MKGDVFLEDGLVWASTVLFLVHTNFLYQLQIFNSGGYVKFPPKKYHSRVRRRGGEGRFWRMVWYGHQLFYFWYINCLHTSFRSFTLA